MSNMPIREVGRSGERKNPRGMRKKRKNPRPERLGVALRLRLAGLHFTSEAIFFASTPRTVPPVELKRFW